MLLLHQWCIGNSLLEFINFMMLYVV
jgi:hypothetical protein